jgi:hypothetical protein
MYVLCVVAISCMSVTCKIDAASVCFNWPYSERQATAQPLFMVLGVILGIVKP